MSKKGSATRVAHVRAGKLFFASAQENTSRVPLSFKQKRKDLHALVWKLYRYRGQTKWRGERTWPLSNLYVKRVLLIRL